MANSILKGVVFISNKTRQSPFNSSPRTLWQEGTYGCYGSASIPLSSDLMTQTNRLTLKIYIFRPKQLLVNNTYFLDKEQ